MAVERTDQPVVTGTHRGADGGSKEAMVGQKTLNISECLILSAAGNITAG